MRTIAPLALLLLCAACGRSAAPAPDVSESPSLAVSGADFTNADGQLVCPVMGDVIASKEQAVGHTVHEGKTYWFCCDSCQHMFGDDPERYVDGRFLAHLAEEHDGRFGACRHVL